MFIAPHGFFEGVSGVNARHRRFRCGGFRAGEHSFAPRSDIFPSPGSAPKGRRVPAGDHGASAPGGEIASDPCCETATPAAAGRSVSGHAPSRVFRGRVLPGAPPAFHVGAYFFGWKSFQPSTRGAGTRAPVSRGASLTRASPAIIPTLHVLEIAPRTLPARTRITSLTVAVYPDPPADVLSCRHLAHSSFSDKNFG